MRRFIVEVLLDAVLLLFIVLLLGIISVGQPFPFGPTSVPILSLRGAGIIGFVSWAAVLVLVNRFARPVLVALTGRLLFSTMGFFVVIINAVAIYITSFFAPIKIADVAQPTLLWVIVAAALYTALSTVMDAVLGLNRPDLGADRSRGIWGFLESLPTPRRNAILENLRLQQVYNAIYSTSLDIALADTPIGPIRRWFARVVLGDKDVLDDATGPERIVAMLEQLGPTYVKIGQMMASRADILPANWITELSKLQSEAAPFGYDDVVTIVTKELGAPPEELYETFDPIPFAAASTAQVHEARLHDGTLVAVKVQRPRIQAKTQADLGVIQELAGVAERRFAVARKVGLTGHRRRVRPGRPQGARLPQRGVPRAPPGGRHAALPGDPRPDGLGRAVGPARHHHGVRQRDQDLEGGRAPRCRLRHDRARDRLHPGDHQAGPGRWLLPRRPAPGQHPRPTRSSKQIIFLDLGLVGQLSAQQRVDLLGLIYSIKEVDIPGIGDGLLALGKPTRQFNEARYRDDIDRLARQYLIYGKATSLGDRRSGRSCPPSSTTASSSTAS